MLDFYLTEDTIAIAIPDHGMLHSSFTWIFWTKIQILLVLN